MTRKEKRRWVRSVWRSVDAHLTVAVFAQAAIPDRYDLEFERFGRRILAEFRRAGRRTLERLTRT